MRDFDWEILATLYKTRNITKAAELLYITQPTLTRRLQQIEVELDSVLVLRNNKGIRFTPEGEFVSHKAVEILDMISDVKYYLSGAKQELSGKLRVGAPNSFMNFVIPTLIEQFSSRYPKVQIDLHTNLSHELLQALEKGEMDVCFVRGEHDTHLKKELLSKDQIYIFSKDPLQLSDLPDLPQITYTKERSIVTATRRWWQERYDAPPQVRYRVHSGDACLQLVRKGLGYAFFSDGRYFSPDDGLHAYALSFLDGTTFTRDSWLVYDSERTGNHALKKFVEFVDESYDELCNVIPIKLTSAGSAGGCVP